jgi:hypothetical protein
MIEELRETHHLAPRADGVDGELVERLAELRTSTKLISMTEAAYWASIDMAELRGARMALEAGDRWLQQQYGLSPLCADLDPAAIVKGTPDE